MTRAKKQTRRGKTRTTKDTVSVNKVVPSLKIGTIPQLRSPTSLYASLYGNGGRSDVFCPSEYDLAECQRIEDVEAYVSESFVKKEGLMLKEGWSLTGKNLATVKYIKERFRQIAHASAISTEELLRRICGEIVRKSNAFLVKVRKIEASGGVIREMPGTSRSLDPVAAYFLAPAETMFFKLDRSGKRVDRWMHSIDQGQTGAEYKIENIVHFTFKRKEGFVTGTPSIVPVIDDVKVLRKIEENVELLLYQHIFPLFHYKVGSKEHPASITEDGYDEIEVARNTIQHMPAEGGIVTSERHDIKLLGVEGRIISAEGYLEHFKKRVFAGLSMSSVDFGEAGAANRATSQTISKNLVDAVKNLQRSVENVFNSQIIEELLLESDFRDIDPLSEDNVVRLRFNEVDLEARQSKENHHVDMFLKNAISHDEMRVEMGRESIRIPTREENQNGNVDEVGFPEWFRMNWKLFEEPKALIQAVDEPWSAASQAAAQNRSIEMGKPELTSAQVAQPKPKEPAKKASDNRDAKVLAEGLRTVEGIHSIPVAKTHYEKLCADILFLVSIGDLGVNLMRSHVDAFAKDLKKDLLANVKANYLRGYTRQNPRMAGAAPSLADRLSYLRKRVDVYSQRFADDLKQRIDRKVLRGDKETYSESVIIVLDAMQYRPKLIDDFEQNSAYMLGAVDGVRDFGVKSIEVKCEEAACGMCKSMAGTLMLSGDYRERLLPFHGDCKCFFQWNPPEKTEPFRRK